MYSHHQRVSQRHSTIKKVQAERHKTTQLIGNLFLESARKHVQLTSEDVIKHKRQNSITRQVKATLPQTSSSSSSSNASTTLTSKTRKENLVVKKKGFQFKLPPPPPNLLSPTSTNRFPPPPPSEIFKTIIHPVPLSKPLKSKKAAPTSLKHRLLHTNTLPYFEKQFNGKTTLSLDKVKKSLMQEKQDISTAQFQDIQQQQQEEHLHHRCQSELREKLPKSKIKNRLLQDKFYKEQPSNNETSQTLSKTSSLHHNKESVELLSDSSIVESTSSNQSSGSSSNVSSLSISSIKKKKLSKYHSSIRHSVFNDSSINKNNVSSSSFFHDDIITTTLHDKNRRLGQKYDTFFIRNHHAKALPLESMIQKNILLFQPCSGNVFSYLQEIQSTIRKRSILCDKLRDEEHSYLMKVAKQTALGDAAYGLRSIKSSHACLKKENSKNLFLSSESISEETRALLIGKGIGLLCRWLKNYKRRQEQYGFNIWMINCTSFKRQKCYFTARYHKIVSTRSILSFARRHIKEYFFKFYNSSSNLRQIQKSTTVSINKSFLTPSILLGEPYGIHDSIFHLAIGLFNTACIDMNRIFYGAIMRCQNTAFQQWVIFTNIVKISKS